MKDREQSRERKDVIAASVLVVTFAGLLFGFLQRHPCGYARHAGGDADGNAGNEQHAGRCTGTVWP